MKAEEIVNLYMVACLDAQRDPATLSRERLVAAFETIPVPQISCGAWAARMQFKVEDPEGDTQFLANVLQASGLKVKVGAPAPETPAASPATNEESK